VILCKYWIRLKHSALLENLQEPKSFLPQSIQSSLVFCTESVRRWHIRILQWEYETVQIDFQGLPSTATCPHQFHNPTHWLVQWQQLQWFQRLAQPHLGRLRFHSNTWSICWMIFLHLWAKQYHSKSAHFLTIPRQVALKFLNGQVPWIS